MELIGKLDKKFRKVDGDVCYYDMTVQIGNKRRETTLPRYHPMLGWIEIFGFVPQHEWVVLDDIKPFTKKATLSINGEDIKEKIDFNLNKKESFHTIITTRELGDLKEVFTWTEDYSKAPDVIKDSGIFESDGNNYKYTVEQNLVSYKDLGRLNGDQQKFIKDVTNKHGKSGAIWLKKFKAKGVLPNLFYKMFPIGELVDLSDVEGSIVEVGYSKKDGEKIDRSHGNWFKLLAMGDEKYVIEEDNYSSTSVAIGGKKQTVENTYSKKLYKV